MILIFLRVCVTASLLFIIIIIIVETVFEKTRLWLNLQTRKILAFIMLFEIIYLFFWAHQWRITMPITMLTCSVIYKQQTLLTIRNTNTNTYTLFIFFWEKSTLSLYSILEWLLSGKCFLVFPCKTRFTNRRITAKTT